MNYDSIIIGKVIIGKQLEVPKSFYKKSVKQEIDIFPKAKQIESINEQFIEETPTECLFYCNSICGDNRFLVASYVNSPETIVLKHDYVATSADNLENTDNLKCQKTNETKLSNPPIFHDLRELIKSLKDGIYLV